MELFPNGAFVRLRSLGRLDKYLHADEDGNGISLRALGAAAPPSVNAVWRAERWPVVRDDAFLLQGAAYGRYLAVSPSPSPPPRPRGHRGGVRAAVQRDFDSPAGLLDDAFMWSADAVADVGDDADADDDAGHGHGSSNCVVRLRSGGQRCLRANGRYRYWNNGVTVVDVVGDGGGRWTTMMQWKVEAVPVSPYPLRLPPPPPIRLSHGLFKPRHRGRRIRYMRLDNEGNFIYDHWREFDFYDNSVSNLWTDLAFRQNDKNITLCVRVGMYALVIPLLTNLPRNKDPMDIMVLTTGSPAAGTLEYPQFDAQQP